MRTVFGAAVAAILIASLFAAGGCNCPGPGADAGDGGGGNTGISVAFSTAAGVVGLSRIESVVTGSVGTDTVSLPTTPTNLIIAPATYYVLISGSPGSGTIGEHTITDPGPNYTITINGFNSSNVLVGTTTTNVNVNPGQVESVFLTLQP